MGDGQGEGCGGEQNLSYLATFPEASRGPTERTGGGGRTPALTRARALPLGVHPNAIPKAVRRGALATANWRRLLPSSKES